MTLICCKDRKNKEADNQSALIENQVNDQFSLSIHVVFKTNDYFQLFYTDDVSHSFTQEKSILIAVKASDTLQVVTFKLPKHVYPLKIRFDLGVEKIQDDIQISNCKIISKYAVFEMNEDEFLDYFSPNSNIIFNDGYYKLVESVKENKYVYDPCFISNKNLNLVLESMINL